MNETGRNAEEKLLLALPRLLHLDDQRRLSFFRDILKRENPPDPSTLPLADQRMLEGLLLTLFSREERDRTAALQTLWAEPAVRSELLELLAVLEDRAEHETPPLSDVLEDSKWQNVPLAIHACYALEEITAAIGRGSLESRLRPQKGFLWDESTNADYLFVTLEKSEKHYSPTTRYRDYAISPDLFHWESGSNVHERSTTGARYISQGSTKTNVFLFVRQRPGAEGTRTGAYTFLGPAEYLRHTGERPMAIVWSLHRPMPTDFFKFAAVAGA